MSKSKEESAIEILVKLNVKNFMKFKQNLIKTNAKKPFFYFLNMSIFSPSKLIFFLDIPAYFFVGSDFSSSFSIFSLCVCLCILNCKCIMCPSKGNKLRCLFLCHRQIIYVALVRSIGVWQ